jgi:superkiller protein 3
LGIALAHCGHLDEAIRHFQKVVEIEPDEAAAHNNLGSALLYCGRVDEAIAQYQRALEIRPDLADARVNLDRALGVKRGAN